MGRISNLSDDRNIQPDDRLVGSDRQTGNNSSNFRIGDLADFVENRITGGFVPSYLFTVDSEGNFVESFLQNVIDTTSVESSSSVDGSNLNLAVYASSENTIVVGSGLGNSVFTSTATVVGSRVILRNREDSSASVVSTITLVDTNTRTITISPPIPGGNFPIFSRDGNLRNELAISRNVSINIEGTDTLSELSDVSLDTDTLENNQVLTFNGRDWSNRAFPPDNRFDQVNPIIHTANGTLVSGLLHVVNAPNITLRMPNSPQEGDELVIKFLHHNTNLISNRRIENQAPGENLFIDNDSVRALSFYYTNALGWLII